MKLLLDTHVLVWAVESPERLGRRVSRLLADPATTPLAVSAITPWEIAMLVSRGRLVLGKPVKDWLGVALDPAFVELLPLDPSIAVESCSLPGDFHADPADRILVATARLRGLSLVTADEKILAYPHVKTVGVA